MIEKLKLIHRDYHSCEEDIIETVSNALGRSCEYMYCHAWAFEYAKGQETIGRRLFEGENNVFNNIRLYHGIEFKDSGVYSVDSIDEMVLKGIVSTPLVIYADDIHYPWISPNRLVNKPHPFLITGITDKAWVCMDPYMQVESVELEKTCISKSMMKLQTIIVNTSCPDSRSLDTFVFSSAYKILVSKENMNSFIQDMYSLNSLDEEIKIYQSHIKSDLLDRITYIARRRMQYAKYISYLASHHRKGMTCFVKCFEKLSIKWQVVGKKLLKVYCMNSWDKEKIYFCKLMESALTDEVLIANAFIERGSI